MSKNWLVKSGARRPRYVKPEDFERSVKTAEHKPKELPAESETRVVNRDDPDGEPRAKQAGELDFQVDCQNKGAQEVFDRMCAKESRDRRHRDPFGGE